MAKKNGFSSLKTFDKEDSDLLNVIVETPKGSRNKFAFDPKLNLFELTKVLPEGMTFPRDFGFIPSTRGQDGDPLDALILMDEPAYPGVLVKSRLIGVFECLQTEDDKTERNDRFVVVAAESHTHSNIKELNDLNSKMLKEVEEFFVNYNKQAGKKLKVCGRKDSKTALKMIRAGKKAAQ